MRLKESPVARETEWEVSSSNQGGDFVLSNPREVGQFRPIQVPGCSNQTTLPPTHRRSRPVQSHEAAARGVQRPLQAQGRMRRARSHQSAAQQLAEKTQHVPVVLRGALEVAAAPAPAHQGGQRAPRPEAQPLPVPLVAYHEDGSLGCARRPVGQMGTRAAMPDTPRPETTFPRSGHTPVARDPPQETPAPNGPKTA